ncbi:MAG: SusC/RagA family TonB-linked outer membrane protein [Mangrovibacterium sp.]
MGTTTDIDGKYAIEATKGAMLSYSFIGMTTVTKAANSAVINVRLQSDAIGLEEVVAVGYGVQKKKDVTGAVASVSGDDLEEVPVADVTQALQGRLSGVNVVSADGRPGAETSIKIRGGGSITQSNDPLYIVDGFPVSSISDILADQIKSIDVLKDASSTAIYGSRGANGVILITTKQGEAGKVTVSYSGYGQVKTPAKTADALNAQQYMYSTWAYGTALGSGYGDAVAEYFGLGSDYGNHYADYADVDAHDYTDDILGTAWSQSHNITVTGGTDKTKVYASLGYLNDNGIQMNTGYKRGNANFKINQELSDNLKMNVDIRYAQSSTQNRVYATNGKGSIPSSAYMFSPIDNPLGDGNYAGFGNGDQNLDPAYSPEAQINNEKQIQETENFRTTIGLDWTPLKGLTAHTEASMTKTHGLPAIIMQV